MDRFCGGLTLAFKASSPIQEYDASLVVEAASDTLSPSNGHTTGQMQTNGQILAYSCELTFITVIGVRCVVGGRGGLRHPLPLIARSVLLKSTPHKTLNFRTRRCPWGNCMSKVDRFCGALTLAFKASSLIQEYDASLAVEADSDTLSPSTGHTTGQTLKTLFRSRGGLAVM